MNALNNMSQINPFLYPGIKMVTNANDRFPIDQQILEQYKSGAWHPFGHLFAKAR